MTSMTHDTAMAWLDDAADSDNEADTKAVAYIVEYIKWLERHLSERDIADCRKAAEEYANATDDDGDALDGGT